MLNKSLFVAVQSILLCAATSSFQDFHTNIITADEQKVVAIYSWIIDKKTPPKETLLFTLSTLEVSYYFPALASVAINNLPYYILQCNAGFLKVLFKSLFKTEHVIVQYDFIRTPIPITAFDHFLTI